MSMVYSLNDFESISWANKFVIPHDILEKINELSNQVGAPSYVKTPSFSNDKSTIRKKKKSNENLQDWEMVRNFQKTEIVKKEGIEKDLDSIRLLINKITEKTYDKIFEKLKENFNKENPITKEWCNLIIEEIFKIATNSKFNNYLYAKLCFDLKDIYTSTFETIFEKIKQHSNIYENICYVDPEKDYDQFCENNIVNEKRRSIGLFLTNLYLNNVIPFDVIKNNITLILSKIIETTKNDDSKMINDELSENLSVYLTNLPKNKLKNTDEWKEIYDNLLTIKQININENEGISHKCKFKFMDIIDSLNKNNFH